MDVNNTQMYPVIIPNDCFFFFINLFTLSQSLNGKKQTPAPTPQPHSTITAPITTATATPTKNKWGEKTNWEAHFAPRNPPTSSTQKSSSTNTSSSNNSNSTFVPAQPDSVPTSINTVDKDTSTTPPTVITSNTTSTSNTDGTRKEEESKPTAQVCLSLWMMNSHYTKYSYLF